MQRSPEPLRAFRSAATVALLVGAAVTVGVAGAIHGVASGSATGPALVATGLLVVGPDRTITHCDEETAEVFDADPEGVVGEPLSALFDPDDLDLDLDGDGGRSEWQREDRTYEVEVAPVENDAEGTGRALAFTDVTEPERLRQELARTERRLDLVTQLNRVVRSVNEVLVTSGTQESILEGTADRLADSELYDAAWAVETPLVDAVDADGGGSAPRAPGETDPADAVDDPASEAVVEATFTDGRQLLAVHDDSEALPIEPESFGIDAPDSTEGRWTTVPVVYGQTAYGSIVLFSTRDDAFTRRELAVLDDVGRQVGHAVNAVEKELLLISDSVIELEIAATDEDPLAVASRMADCTLRVEGLVPTAGEDVIAYCAVEGTSVHEGFAALSRVDGIARLRPIDDAIVEVQFADGSLAVPLREVGAQLERVVAEDGVCSVVARVAPEADVRAIVDRVQRSVPSAELRSKHHREGLDGESFEEAFPSGLADQLTERQLDTLETAYSAGYFEWPRESTAEDLADEMGVTSPTVHNHLRKAENVVLNELLEGDEE